MAGAPGLRGLRAALRLHRRGIANAATRPTTATTTPAMVPAKAPVLKLFEAASAFSNADVPVVAPTAVVDTCVPFPLFMHPVLLPINTEKGGDCEKRLAVLAVSNSITVYCPGGTLTAGQSNWHATDGIDVVR